MRIFRKAQRRVKGSTLLEAIVASSILLSIVTLFYTQQMNINASLNFEAIYNAHQLINKVFYEDELFVENQSSYEVEGFVINKKILISEDDLFQVKVTVVDRTNKVIYSRTKWISNRIEL